MKEKSDVILVSLQQQRRSRRRGSQERKHYHESHINLWFTSNLEEKVEKKLQTHNRWLDNNQVSLQPSFQQEKCRQEMKIMLVVISLVLLTVLCFGRNASELKNALSPSPHFVFVVSHGHLIFRCYFLSFYTLSFSINGSIMSLINDSLFCDPSRR